MEFSFVFYRKNNLQCINHIGRQFQRSVFCLTEVYQSEIEIIASEYVELETKYTWKILNPCTGFCNLPKVRFLTSILHVHYQNQCKYPPASPR